MLNEEIAVREMSRYENWSLLLTGIYNLLTFLLLAFTVYIAVVQRRIPNIALYYKTRPKDTKQWGGIRPNIDFVLENRGIELRNVSLKSEPDFLGWANIGEASDQITPKATSEYFKIPFPCLHQNYQRSFFWCDAAANKEVLDKPFRIIVEFDNPVFFFPKRLKRSFDFDLSPKGILDGVNSKFDEHNIAQEMARARESLEKISEHLKLVSVEINDPDEKSPTGGEVI
ncbi:MAG TPA: hypothetical protein PKD24_13785 [Pyrinomonadaceae bacterium]|nr:hypothetical protein [Pyrinomonadaceae bacterium]HMP66561.1 hypothetical protein [Pyrinomonadaceae bacterium]